VLVQHLHGDVEAVGEHACSFDFVRPALACLYSSSCMYSFFKGAQSW
jgi:hypothetical protein